MPPLALAPSVLTPDAVNEHIDNLIALGLTAPRDWAFSLALAAAKLTADLEVTESELRLKRMLADCRPDLSDEEKSAVRVETALALAAARAVHRVGTIARPVFENACVAGEARHLQADTNSAVAASEAEIASLRQTISERSEPANLKESMAINALKEEQRQAERVMLRCSSSDQEETEEELRQLIERNKYQWEPTQEGFTARMNEIEEEIERLQEVIEEAPDPNAGKPPIIALMEALSVLEAPLNDMRTQAGKETDLAGMAESKLEANLMIFRMNAAGILRCHELDSEAAKLAGFTQLGNPGDSQEPAA